MSKSRCTRPVFCGGGAGRPGALWASPPHPHLWGGLRGAPRGDPGPSKPPQNDFDMALASASPARDIQSRLQSNCKVPPLISCAARLTIIASFFYITAPTRRTLMFGRRNPDRPLDVPLPDEHDTEELNLDLLDDLPDILEADSARPAETRPPVPPPPQPPAAAAPAPARP